MPGVIVVGAQWGDEGKGKIIDLLSAKADHVARAQGGNNAGHTLLIGKEEYKLHLVPSGILQPQTTCHIGAGTVIDPRVLHEEIRLLESKGHPLKGRLWISPAAHLILPYHLLQDVGLEERKGKLNVGTTGRGIGPCYADKAHRIGIRICDWMDAKHFAETLASVLPLKNAELSLYGIAPLALEAILQEYSPLAEALRPYVASHDQELSYALERGENVLLEGAQGTLLDITHGNYPYVTSSGTLAAAICHGAGLGPSAISHTVGVIKAYVTRVGQGPMPTETDELNIDHRQAREYGTTTGRKRRIGWWDGVAARAAVRLNGIQSLAVTKLDILDTLPEIKLCVAYEHNGKHIHTLPASWQQFAEIKPIYETLPGWQSKTSSIRDPGDLPREARSYLKRIEQLCAVPISIVSLGPERESSLILRDIF